MNDAEQKLNEFTMQVRERTQAVNAARGKEAEQLQMELSQFIGKQMQLLLQQGLPVMAIQDVIRAAFEDITPSAHEPAEAENYDGELVESLISAMVCYLPMEGEVIDSFAAGNLSKSGFIEKVGDSTGIETFENLSAIEYILTDFGKDETFSMVTDGGEIVAGADGEAFIPETLTFTEQGGSQFVICEPMVFKTASEVKEIKELLETVNEKIFFKKADVEKLIKFGEFDNIDVREAKRNADIIVEALWEDFVRLREVYCMAAARNAGMVIFVSYSKA